jgi:hypothetical protein
MGDTPDSKVATGREALDKQIFGKDQYYYWVKSDDFAELSSTRSILEE